MELFAQLAAWVRRPLADGIALYDRDVPDQQGLIRIREKLRPLCGFRALLDRVIGAFPDYLRSRIEIGKATRVVTLEGEHAIMATLAATLPDGHRAERTVAMIVADDAYALIEASISVEEHFARYRNLTRMLAENYYLALGEARRRMYEYAPPPGFGPRRSVHQTRWLHPRFPAVPVSFLVHDAAPVGVNAASRADQLLFVNHHAAYPRERGGPTALTTAHGLDGAVYRRVVGAPGGRSHVLVEAELADRRFSYRLTLETTDATREQDEAALLEMIQSVVPVPADRSAERASSLIEWID